MMISNSNKIDTAQNLFQKISLFLLIIVTYYFISYYMLGILPNEDEGKWVWILSICINLLLIARSFILNDKTGFIIYIFISLYVIEAGFYFIFGTEISFHSSLKSYNSYFETLLQLTLFLLIGLIFKRNIKKVFVLEPEKNQIVFIVNLSISVIIFFIGKTGFKESTPINEYFVIFLYTAYYYSGKKRINLLILISLTALYIAKNILLGGRIEAIQVIILVFVVYFQNRISIKKILFFCIVGSVIFSIYERVRPYLKDGSFEKILATSNASSSSIRISNQGDVIYASSRIITMINRNIISVGERLESFSYFMISPFYNGKSLPKIQNLSLYLNNDYTTGGGGLAPVFFYAWLGIPGIIFFSIIIAKLNSSVQTSRNFLVYTYSVLFVSTFPRWFAYYPTNLIKLCIIGALYAFFVKVLIDGFRIKKLKVDNYLFK